jgi:hypothetical protein
MRATNETCSKRCHGVLALSEHQTAGLTAMLVRPPVARHSIRHRQPLETHVNNFTFNMRVGAQLL